MARYPHCLRPLIDWLSVAMGLRKRLFTAQLY